MDWSDSENPADANKAVFREGYTHVLRAGLGWLSSLLLAPVVNHLQRARDVEVVGKTEGSLCNPYASERPRTESAPSSVL